MCGESVKGKFFENQNLGRHSHQKYILDACTKCGIQGEGISQRMTLHLFVWNHYFSAFSRPGMGTLGWCCVLNVVTIVLLRPIKIKVADSEQNNSMIYKEARSTKNLLSLLTI